MVRVGSFILIFVLIIIGISLTSCNLAEAPLSPTADIVTLTPQLTCDELITTALQTTSTLCSPLGVNQACYGNQLITTELQPSAVVNFANPGDIAPLTALRSISTMPFDEIAQLWGIAILQAQANIPNTLPGQNVTFILFGEASMAGVTPEMQAVTLSTGIGRVACAAAPPSAILIQSPEGVKTEMKFNGATVTLGSTLYFTAVSNTEMTVAVLAGSATVAAFNVTQNVLPGAQVRLPLGGPDGLQVSGPPSPPEPYNLADISLAPLLLLPLPVQLPQPIAPQTPQTPTATSVRSVPAPVPTSCIVRADWPATYIIQQGDTLLSIARRLNISLLELQRGNCIANPNLLRIGQTLRVPFALPTATRRPVITSTSTATQSTAPTKLPPPTDTPLRPPSDTPPPAQTQSPLA
jgi:LysM repeat protein